MIPLTSTTDTLEAVLSGAGTDRIVVIYYDVSQSTKGDISEYKRSRQITALTGATDVTIIAAPQQNYTRHIEEIYFYSAGSITITIHYDDNATETILVSQALVAGETLYYHYGFGWTVF